MRPLVGMGLISYGVYLWHWPITVWVTEESTGLADPALFVLRSALTLGASLASYHLIEQPIRHHGLAWGGKPRLWVTPVAVTALSLGFLLPVILNPAIPRAPEGQAPTAALAASTQTYTTSPRCDVEETAAAPLSTDGTLTITHIGNSLAGEVRPCLTDILSRRDVEMVTVNPPDFLLCREAEAIEEQATNPETRPDAAILFLFVAYDDRCGSPWHRTVDELVATWISQGTHVFLVPSVSVPPGGMEELQPGIDLEIEYYNQLAAADPENITAVDAGAFLRDVDGTYLWRMPCTGPDEAGCREDGTVPVRFVDGLHFCTDADFPARGCVREEAAAGERRAATAIANTVIDVMSRKDAAASG